MGRNYSRPSIESEGMMVRKMRVFLAMDDEALMAYRDREFGYTCFSHLLLTARQLVNDGEIPSMPIDSQTMGVACDIAMLEKLVKHSQEKRKNAKRRKNAMIREMILANAVA
ncbi:MAG: hypothetical protein Q7S43_01215 [bacterium]|nr:hypothetical protein [bacterium]